MKKKEFDLTTEKGRARALGQLENNCLTEMIEKEFELCPFAIVRVSERQIEIGIIDSDQSSSYFGHMAFASEITLQAKANGEYFPKENQINFGTCGSFDPSQKESYWRSLHAATILKNWDEACSICNRYCDDYKDLLRRIEIAETNKENKLKETQTN